MKYLLLLFVLTACSDKPIPYAFESRMCKSMCNLKSKNWNSHFQITEFYEIEDKLGNTIKIGVPQRLGYMVEE